ncbi:MAG: heavy metal-associated domain-containing protein [Flavobacteriales bacterium]
MRNLLLLLLMLPAFAVQAQSKKSETLEIRTSAVCDMCVVTIEGEMIYEKGVKKVKLDLATNVISVEYDPRKTEPDALRKAVTDLGYYADDLPGDAKAFAALPDCCQKEGCGKPAAPASVPEQ